MVFNVWALPCSSTYVASLSLTSTKKCSWIFAHVVPQPRLWHLSTHKHSLQRSLSCCVSLSYHHAPVMSNCTVTIIFSSDVNSSIIVTSIISITTMEAIMAFIAFIMTSYTWIVNGFNFFSSSESPDPYDDYCLSSYPTLTFRFSTGCNQLYV